ncbi:MAG: chromosomal replication initiator protein DnaA [Candidatus Accumulibacter sp.]|nr:chromosomal replication initiator protein DnaA [Accumulibacter sp.]
MSFWDTCLSHFERELPPQQVAIWIRPLRLEGEESPGGALRLVAPNAAIRKFVRDRYLGRIEELGQEYFSAPITISLDIDASATSPGAPANPPLEASHIAAQPAVRPYIGGAYEQTRLIPDFTFDNLIVGKANDLARAAAHNVASSPRGGAYNPLFIYGGTGLGKTHLIHAIGNRIVEQGSERVVRYVHANDYFNDVVKATLRRDFDAFKRYYRSLDVLLLDDVQFFSGKTRTQEEFFFLFNSLIESKKQIVISCDTYSRDISGLEDRLKTRFGWGLTVQIEPPETEMRIAILKKKAEMENITLNDEVAFYIAKHLRSNVRELEGALKKVLAYASFHDRKVDLDLAKEALKDLIGAVNRQITVENIQKTVADYYGIRMADLLSRRRTRQIARPRQIAMWLAKDLTSQSYPSIGEAFGGRDHTTVLHAVRTIDSLRERDNELNHDVHVLLQTLKG